MTTTITVDDEILPDLRLVKRVTNKRNMTETIRFILDRAGYNEKWMEYMTALLEDMREGSE